MFCKIVIATVKKQNRRPSRESNLQQAPSNDETLSSAAEFFTFGIAELFNRSAGKGKEFHRSGSCSFSFALVFLRKTFFEMMRENSPPWGKDTFYRFLSESRINWRRFLLVLAKRLLDTTFFFLSPWREETGYLPSTIPHTRGTGAKVELLSKCYDHCDHRHFRGSACSPSAGRTEALSASGLFLLLRRRRRTDSSEPERPTEEQGARTDGKEAVMKTPGSGSCSS